MPADGLATLGARTWDGQVLQVSFHVYLALPHHVMDQWRHFKESPSSDVSIGQMNLAIWDVIYNLLKGDFWKLTSLTSLMKYQYLPRNLVS